VLQKIRCVDVCFTKFIDLSHKLVQKNVLTLKRKKIIAKMLRISCEK